MSKKILVTGATGTVGGEVAKQLAAAGHSFVCGVRNPDTVDAYPATKLDFRDTSTFAPALEGVHAIFLIAPGFVEQADELIIPLIQAAVANGVTHAVYSSVLGAENNPAGAHRKIEMALEESGMTYTLLRPSFYMQNFVTYEKDNLDKGVIYLPVNDGKTGYVDVQDIAACAVSILTDEAEQHANQAYVLTGPEAITHEQIAGILSNSLGRTIEHVNPSPEAFVDTLKQAQVPTSIIEQSAALYGYIRDGWCAAVTDDVQQILNRLPTSFSQFAERENQHL